MLAGYKRGVLVVTIIKDFRNSFRKKLFKDIKMRTPAKLAIGSGVAFIIIIIFWIAFPMVIKSSIRKNLALKKGSEIREMYTKVPFALDFKIYVFNVTNPVEVTAGAKPIVQEVGPFVYGEWKEKVDIVDDESDDTMTYTIKNTFIFNPIASLPLTGNEVVTIPHPLIAGLVMAVLKEKPSAMNLINKAVNSIYRNPTTPFLTAPVNKILFDGIDLACNVTDFAGKAVCTQLKLEGEGIIEVEPGILRFSLFGPKNGTNAQRIKVKRGVKDISELGKLIEVDGQKELTIWSGKECNTFKGTDSTIFPPFLKKEDGLVSHGPDICRSLIANYEEDTSYEGIPVRRYSADLGDSSTIKEEKCFCVPPDKCFKKGIMDLGPCVGAPFIASLPHFYKSHEMYINSVFGLNPNEEEHAINILFEPLTGSPVAAAKRLQFALPLEPIPKITVMKNLPVTYMPLFWVEEGVKLNSTWYGPLKSMFKVFKITKIVKWLVLVCSLGGMAGAAYLHFTKTGEATITPVQVETKKNNVISMLGQNGNSEGGHLNHAMSNNEIDKY